ncbi:MAG: hypothetical protein A2X49_07090 [Lentisphaerae bacterium GWF2_52_8]|nr:MAG: hypothetical protein A2X49_07090 [Lentisphaerae bacterium GWF2_52_8]
MTKQKLKWLLIPAASAALLIAAMAASVAVKYWHIRKLDPASELLGRPEMKPGTKIKLGETLTFKLRVLSPWNRRPLETEATPGTGTQLKSPPEWRRVAFRWGYFVWELSTPLQAFRTGKIPEGKLNFSFEGHLKGAENGLLEEKIPSVEVEALSPATKDLKIAGRLKENGSKWQLYTGIALAVLLLAVLAFFFLRKKRKAQKQAVVWPWDRAIEKLNKLREAMSKARFRPEECLARLSDIVRVYLEERFRLHAPRQTTTEFLAELERPGSPMSDEQRRFLKDFLEISDLVKFATYPAEKDTLENALAKAERLVIETKPLPAKKERERK